MLKFIFGIFTGLQIYGLVQDILGKEKYIDYITNNWIDSAKTLPYHIILIIILIIGAYSFK